MIEDRIKIVLGKHFSGESTPEEDKAVVQWLRQDEANKLLYQELKDVWEASSSENFAPEEAFSAFKAKTAPFNPQKRISIHNFLKYAALLVILIGIPVILFLMLNLNRKSNSLTTIYCHFGDRTSITLPDSSRVWLNSGSKLSFQNNFSEESREIILEGEAYFSVKKDPSTPFKVITPDLTVEVLGTQFNFKAYPDESESAVTLTEGSLKVIHGGNSSLLTPNQKLNLHRESKKARIENIENLEVETGWTKGRLAFRNETLAELERKLERWFDVEIEFADELVKSRRFSGILERESILEVISYFGSSRYVDYKVDGNIITFESQSDAE